MHIFYTFKLFSFLQNLVSNTHIIASVCDTYTCDYFSIPKEIYSADDYFSLNLKVVNCVFQVQKNSFTPINEAKPFHFIFLSAQLITPAVCSSELQHDAQVWKSWEVFLF